ncbi:APC family permease [Swaminathania salitolerans]|uniref:Amino acid transporter n=1 Tax=Swaminathania salitolerans TaxID=182838 RepID=A0A511BQM1_9PROT|nr:amino acid permease [Swaminathania salitolerans]GBQ11842.1 amino acid transporter [Swaminathania salitolerans LMG 21291]GEL02641.1 amino acid transporter [Swaminathania salitolerans]
MANGESRDLHRQLGPVSLLLMGIGSVVGAGIYVLPGIAAAHFAGPAVSLSFVLAAISCGFTGLCYAELASALPDAMGGAYGYARAILGIGAGWWVAWMLVLEYSLAGSAVSVGLTGYLSGFLASCGLVLPARLINATIQWQGGAFHLVPQVNLVAFLLVVSLGIVLTRGIRQASWTNGCLVLLKLAVLLVFVLVGCGHVDPTLWHPFLPPSEGGFSFGWLGLLRAVAVVSFAYLGFDSISIAASEARNPGRDVPLGLIGALATSAVLYVAVSLVMTGLVPFRQLGVASPVALAVQALGMPFLGLVLQFGSVIGLTSVLFVSLYGQSRLCHILARDRLIAARFAQVDPGSGAPVPAIVTIAALTALTAAFLPITLLADLVSIGTMIGFLFIAVAVMRLRRETTRPPSRFRVPFPGIVLGQYWIGLVPVLSILACLVNLGTVLTDLVTQCLGGDWIPLSFLALYCLAGGVLWRRLPR